MPRKKNKTKIVYLNPFTCDLNLNSMCLATDTPKHNGIEEKKNALKVNAHIKGHLFNFLRREGAANSKGGPYLKGGNFFIYQFLASK